MLKETKEQKEARIFNAYKRKLKKLNMKHDFLRFNVIEYTCRFPELKT